MKTLDVQKIKLDFPIFTTHPDLVYLDSAATSQKPIQVIDAVKDFYEQHNANIHRGLYDLSQDATILFENSRKKVADFIGAKDASEIIFTGSTTEAINLVAYSWAQKFLKPGDCIVTSEMEHHSNLVPWLRLQKQKGIELIFLPLQTKPDSEQFRLQYQTLLQTQVDKKKIKLVALTHASNVLGTINPINTISTFLKDNGINAKILVDAAQSIPHIPINVQEVDCDFLVFSSHKMLGPSGVGVLWAKKELLDTMDPLFYGSHMIKQVGKTSVSFADIPDKFEAGTRNLEGAIGLAAALDYLSSIGFANIQQHEQQLMEQMLTMLKSYKNLSLFGPHTSEARLGVFSFNIGDVHPHDVAEILNRQHIAVRSGHHCAQVLMDVLDQPATVRVSLYLYNTKEDIEKLSEGIALVNKVFST